MPISSITANNITEIGQRLYSHGLIAGTDGNISARLDDDKVMITPSGISKGRLNPEDMIIIDQKGTKISGDLQASSESAMHLHLYINRPDISACVHAHPPYATAFAVAGISLNDKVLPEVQLTVGNIALTEYAPPGTSEVSLSLDPYISDHNAFLLKNHGLVAIGHSLEEAYNRLEIVEHFAQILFLAKHMGHVDVLDMEEISRLEIIRKRMFEENPGHKQ